MDPKTLLLIAMGLAGGFIEPTRSTLCSAPDPDPNPGGGGGDPPKFTQAEVQKLIDERMGRASKESEKRTADAVAAAVAKATEESNAKLAELTAKIEDAGKTGAEKAKAEAERTAAAQATRLADAEKKLLAAEKAKADADALAIIEKTGRRTDAFRTQLLTELAAAKTPQAMLADAVDLAIMRSKVTFDDDGKVSVEAFGGTYQDAKSVAAAFLKATPSFAHHPGGGHGSQSSGAGFPQGIQAADLHAGNVDRLLQAGIGRLSNAGSDAVERAAGA